MTDDDIKPSDIISAVSGLLEVESDRSRKERLILEYCQSKNPAILSLADETDLQVLTDVLEAVSNGDYTKLAVPDRDALAEERLKRAAQDNLARIAAENQPVAQKVQTVAPTPRSVAPQPGTVPPDLTEALAVLGRAMAPVMQPQSIDMGEVNKAIDAKVKVAQDAVLELDGVVEQAVKDHEATAKKVEELTEAVAKIKVRPVIEFVIPNAPPVTIARRTHWQMTQIMLWYEACRKAGGAVWVWGKAGNGKTTIGADIAEALGMKERFSCVSVGPTTTASALIGSVNFMDGSYRPGPLYHRYKDGGVMVVDEPATGDAGLLTQQNAAISNPFYMFPSGEMVQKHPDFGLLAFDNTKGTGATAGYTARNRLDASTLDRFAVVELKDDPDLDWFLATGEERDERTTPEWKPRANDDSDVKGYVKWVEQVQELVGDSVLISRRAKMLGASALRHGIPPAEVVEACVFKLIESATQQRIVSRHGHYGK